MSSAPRPKVVFFDLLSALLDSWSLWDDIAGGEGPGRTWRFEYLQRTYAAGAYVPYLDLVADSAEAVGMPRGFASRLAARWDELVPWPGAGFVLRGLARDWPLGVVTNCSDELGRRAAALVGAPFRTVVTAESTGFYKPDTRVYSAGAQAMGVRPDEVLFVAGSPFDVEGADAAGMAVAWQNPLGIAAGRAGEVAIAVLDDIRELPTLLA